MNLNYQQNDSVLNADFSQLDYRKNNIEHVVHALTEQNKLLTSFFQENSLLTRELLTIRNEQLSQQQAKLDVLLERGERDREFIENAKKIVLENVQNQQNARNNIQENKFTLSEIKSIFESYFFEVNVPNSIKVVITLIMCCAVVAGIYKRYSNSAAVTDPTTEHLLETPPDTPSPNRSFSPRKLLKNSIAKDFTLAFTTATISNIMFKFRR